MLDQPACAIGALETVAACSAQRQGRIAAAVEIEQNLLAALNRFRDVAHQTRRQEFAAGWCIRFQINGADFRHWSPAMALGQAEMGVTALRRIDAAFDGRGGGRQDNGQIFNAAAHHRHIAGVVMDTIFLLIGCFMLLIDDDQAQIGVREKQRRARTGNDFGLACCQSSKGSLALAA